MSLLFFEIIDFFAVEASWVFFRFLGISDVNSIGTQEDDTVALNSIFL